MNEKNEEKEKEDWFKKLDFPLKSIHNQYKKLLFKRKEISKNQKILNEFNIRNKSNQIGKIKHDSLPFDEKLLLKRINVYNYKNLEGENNIMKNIITKIKERNNKNKNIKNSYLKLKRFKTNNNYEKIKLNYSSLKKLNNKSINQNRNIKLNLNIKSINNSSVLNTPSITDRNKNSKPLKILINKNKKLILNLEDVNYNDEEKDNNLFKTLTKIEKHKPNDRKIPKKIENFGEMLRIINFEENYGKIINKNILCIKSKKKLNTINQIRNKNRKINLSVNYSNIKSLNDIENKKENNLSLKKNLYRKNSKTLNNNDELIKDNNSFIKEKKSLILPICLNRY